MVASAQTHASPLSATAHLISTDHFVNQVGISDVMVIINVMFGNVIGCLNCNEYQDEVFEWISNFIPHITGYVIIYLCWDYG